MGELWFQEGASSSQASLGFQQGKGTCRSIPSSTLGVPSTAELPKPFPGIHQLTQLCSHGISPSIRMLCPSSKTPDTVLGGHRALVDMEQCCQLWFPIQGLQEQSVWVFEERSSCVKCEILHRDLQGFPTLGWSPLCRVGRFRVDKIVFLAVCDTLILVPCLAKLQLKIRTMDLISPIWLICPCQ